MIPSGKENKGWVSLHLVHNKPIDMSSLDSLLYSWISRANERREDLDLPVGFLEDSIFLLQDVLGAEYLERLLIKDSTPVTFLNDEANPLRKWLLSARVDEHIVQILELVAYFRAFKDDPALPDKVKKLKRDSFWPIFFELAMATRTKRVCGAAQFVFLNSESPSSVGDFTIRIPGYSIPCECSRLGRSPQITTASALEESLSYRISDATKRIPGPLCIKIRSTAALTGATYNGVLQLIRNCISDARRGQLPARHCDLATTMTVDQLTDRSEQLPFRNVNGTVINLTGADWDSAVRFCRVPAHTTQEVSDRFDQGQRFREYEAVRLFMKFGHPAETHNEYSRLSAKLRKKLKQTKALPQHFGKVVLLQVPFDLRKLDSDRLKAAIRDAAFKSRSALAILLTNREPNPQFRHHYSTLGTYNQTAGLIRPDVVELFDRMISSEASIDPISGLPHRRTWTNAQTRARNLAKNSAEFD
jgi:hypothetical protein